MWFVFFYLFFLNSNFIKSLAVGRPATPKPLVLCGEGPRGPASSHALEHGPQVDSAPGTGASVCE